MRFTTWSPRTKKASEEDEVDEHPSCPFCLLEKTELVRLVFAAGFVQKSSSLTHVCTTLSCFMRIDVAKCYPWVIHIREETEDAVSTGADSDAVISEMNAE